MNERILQRKDLCKTVPYESGLVLTYETPADKKRSWLDSVFRETDLAFHLGYFREIFKSRKLALNGTYDNAAWCESSARILDLLENCGGKVKVEGIEKIISVEGPVVIAGNHMSTLETFVLPTFITQHKPITFVVKESLTRGSLFGPIMRSRNPIAVGRNNPREDLTTVLEEGTKRLKNGMSVVVFPQSTRTTDFNPAEFNSIAVKLASRAGVPLIPVALRTDFWENGKIIKELGRIFRNRKINITFGDPLLPNDDSRKNQNLLLSFVVSNLKRWGTNVRES
ncbi:1-acyl-sn-glycerol-3-phosphate acyltransferase [Leptospira gomenensis]|uniref:1-acyl-sn-glycerol-3-phosphate acyltransferase n=1 Tax=Leptospira gomenensis TaxID=2484974 RepID=A0A5F1Y9H5_9LEPT|nr:lysophospholipid acyltransferase family protein [Leptospira gomenensis]TGK32764.1 1-acyl-sn-glycerol-3-phosphate acyltransferase [Leptospira gomenensis]TGK36912.1 1-acyl-sn-glycerol-3-phosphate acyltransferase [Leptospira gomenensis]TGK44383.1 1-acyl-sn-glycerol-3-phosphate acyltransferase [Leptospira gomenensis]TGK58876.1 1-acyl-sn-glycerol-3-phosphate acyltransferase [Leptospira gomenensis]